MVQTRNSPYTGQIGIAFMGRLMRGLRRYRNEW